MKKGRRHFLQLSASTALVGSLGGFKFKSAIAATELRDTLTPFVQNLPIPPTWYGSLFPNLNLNMTSSWHKFHPSLPAVRVFGYGGQYLGPTIWVSKGRQLNLRMKNKVSISHIFPESFDPRLHIRVRGISV